MRYVIEELELMLSSEKMLNPKLNRKKVWEGILSTRPSLFQKLCACYSLVVDDDAPDRDAAIKVAVVDKIKVIYDKVSKEIHKPGIESVPIQLSLLSEAEACVAIHFCDALPVNYDVFSVCGSILSDEQISQLRERRAE